MNIDSIKNGYVIDHIQAGKAMRIYDVLGLAELDCQVALITNAKSKKQGKKDIIKIDKDILEREGNKYNQVYIKINISNLYKVNDVVNISIMNKCVSSLKIFNIIWEGD